MGICAVYSYIDLPVTMLTDIRDCGFLHSKVKLYCFQGSIQPRVAIVKMASVLGCSSNALLAETGAKRLINKKNKKTHKQENNK